MSSDFSHSKRELKNSLENVLDWSKRLEEKYHSMRLLVETLSRKIYKKNKKNQKLKQKIQKYKSKVKTLKKQVQKCSTISSDGKHVVVYQELVDLSYDTDIEEECEEECEEEEETNVVYSSLGNAYDDDDVVVVEKKIENIRIKNEPIAPPSTPDNEVVELEECESVDNSIMEEEDIEPPLEPDSEEEEPEMQPSEEPVLEKEVEEEVEVVEEVVEEVEEVVEEVEEEVEEVVEEVKEVEEVVEEEVEEVVEEEEKVQEEEEEVQEEEELYETTINGKSYYVVSETDGPIYAIGKDEEVGDEVGKYVKGKPVFNTPIAPETTEEDEEMELYTIKINGVNYGVENETNGRIYALGFDEDVEEQVGQYVNGSPVFFKK